MNCNAVAHLEPLYTTGDLDSRTMAEIDLHVGQCPNCAVRWKERDQVDSLLRDAIMAEQVDVRPVVERVQRQIHSYQPRPAARRRTLLIAVASLVITVVLAIALIRKPHRPTLYTYAVEDHVAEVVKRSPRPWTNGSAQIELMVRQHLGVTGLVQTLAPDGYHVERAMICPLARQRYSHLIYSNGAREVSFFVGQKDEAELPGKEVGHANGFSVHSGSVDGLQVVGFQTSRFTILLVGNIPLDEAIRFAMRAAASV